MSKPHAPATLTDRIVEACNIERGLALREIIATTEGHAPSVYAIVPLLLGKGRLHRVGTPMLSRYFAQQAHAAAYALVFEAERAQAIARKIEGRKQRLKDKRAAAHAPRPAAPKAPPQPKKPRQQAAKPRRAAKQGPTIRIGGTKAAGTTQLEPTATVTWPAHVKVQRAPVCRDTRFTFTPPPGWQGEFTREWKQRRRCA